MGIGRLTGGEGPAEHVRNALQILSMAHVEYGRRTITESEYTAIRWRLERAIAQVEGAIACLTPAQ